MLIDTHAHLTDSQYENIDEIDIKKGVREKLIKDKDNAYLSRQLGTIKTDAPVETEYAGYVPSEPDAFTATKILAELENADVYQKELTVYVKKGKLSLAIGHRGETRSLIMSTKKPAHIYFSETDDISENEVKIKIKESNRCD